MNKWRSIILNRKWLCVLIILLTINLQSNAQKDNSTYIDSTVTGTVVAAGSEAHNDTSQNFFTQKANINQPYSTSKIVSRVRADKEVAELKKQDDFWYIKSIEKFKSSPQAIIYDKAVRDSLAKRGKKDNKGARFSEEERYNFNLPSWLSTVMWGVIITVFLFAVTYFLIANKINIFSRNSKNNTNTAIEDEGVDLFSIPYQELLQKAYSEKNYRLAVRILYLQTLKLLSEKNIIAFQADYTNMDYLQQLSHTMFYKDFFAITMHYEYTWYGGFAVSEPAFHTIQHDFTAIQDKILHR